MSLKLFATLSECSDCGESIALNALVLTLAMFLLTIVIGMVAIFQLKDTKVALSLATLFPWLLVALTAAAFQALWNADDLYRVGPFVQLRAGLMKQHT